ncbi:hypothetical protein, partial [Streptomyces albidoflavus]|uniref:hypothetical protein n=1 Tax=Streptomyces albidoflavus TaxID=1886 RepID=UPI0040563FB6
VGERVYKELLRFLTEMRDMPDHPARSPAGRGAYGSMVPERRALPPRARGRAPLPLGACAAKPECPGFRRSGGPGAGKG